MTMIDRNPQGRDTGAEGIVDAVQDRTAQEFLSLIWQELRLLRAALVQAFPDADLGDFQALVEEEG